MKDIPSPYLLPTFKSPLPPPAPAFMIGETCYTMEKCQFSMETITSTSESWIAASISVSQFSFFPSSRLKHFPFLESFGTSFTEGISIACGHIVGCVWRLLCPLLVTLWILLQLSIWPVAPHCYGLQFQSCYYGSNKNHNGSSIIHLACFREKCKSS